MNAPPHHANMGAAYPQYIYHNDKTQQYFGRFDTKEQDIVYDNKYLATSHTSSADSTAATSAGTVQSTGSSTTAASSSNAASSATPATTDSTSPPKEATPYTIHYEIV